MNKILLSIGTSAIAAGSVSAVVACDNGLTKSHVQQNVNQNSALKNQSSKRAFMPYVDLTMQPQAKYSVSDYYNNGAHKMMFAFLQQKATNLSGKPDPAWAATTDPSSADWGTYKNIIDNYKADGGEVGISFGGAANTPIWEAKEATSENVTASLKDMVSTFGAKYIDFDIEGQAQTNTQGLQLLSKSIQDLHRDMQDLQISITLPVLATDGLVNDGLKAYQEIIAQTKLPLNLNIMAMDYGASGEVSEDMAENDISAGEKSLAQIKETFEANKVDFDAKNVGQYLGITPMIGVNDVQTEILSVAGAEKVAQWAVDNNLGELSFWSLGRDKSATGSEIGQVSPTHSGVDTGHDFAFTTSMKKIYYDDGTPTKPVSGSFTIDNYFQTKTENKVTWKGVENAMWYSVSRDGKVVADTLFANNFLDKDVNGQDHVYEIQAHGIDGSVISSQELAVKIVANELTSQVLKYSPSATYATAQTPVWYNGKLYFNKWYVSPGDVKPDAGGDANPWELAPDAFQSLPGYSAQAKADLGL